MLRRPWLMLRLLCLLTLAVAVGVAGYDVVFPWPAAEAALTAFQNKPRLLVSSSYEFNGWAGSTTEHRTGSYAIFPYSLLTFNVVTVSTNTGEATVVEKQRSFLVYCVVYLLAAYGGFALRKRAPWPWRREP